MHEKRNSDFPKTIIFKNEDELKNTVAFIKNVKKNSLTELSPML